MMHTTPIRLITLSPLVLLTLFSLASGSVVSPDASNNKKLYVVYLGALPQVSTSEDVVNSHVKLLSYVKRSEEMARSSLVVSYTKSFNGFAAKLTPAEAEALKGKPGILSVFPNLVRKLLTTRSWDFVGLISSAPRNTTMESNIIVGVMDTGVWPESQMFSDASFGPIPSGWGGECQTGDQFTTHNCNKKLIGAKYFEKGYVEIFGPVNRSSEFLSPRDANGHGSHTSSTAAGSVVEGANLYGLGKGNARGGVPAARVAMYKVCWGQGFCTDADILHGMDNAISDGVDIISMSLGGPPALYFQDAIAISAFHAVQRGIVVACAAGNGGPVVNTAPWIFTVAASTIDRKFYSPILLGNNVTVKGIAINTFEMNDTWYPLITGAQGDFANSTHDMSYCDLGVLNETKVRGKIVYCDGFGAVDLSVLEAGGAGLVYNGGPELEEVASAFLLPTSAIAPSDADKILAYINTTRSPVAKILPCETTIDQLSAPVMAYFSSRGPNIISGDILKPDIVAPGVDILAAWSLNVSLTENNVYDKRYAPYNIISGTSMATPHVSGASAYVKSFHPDWSPAAIKSALMTTAIPFDSTNLLNLDLEFAYGAGGINPTKAIDPGLIYDIGYDDYIIFLCTYGYTSSEVFLITGRNNVVCPSNTTITFDLNYPTISIGIPMYLKDNWYVMRRTLTNVGSTENATYTAKLVVPKGMEVELSPQVLSFSKVYEKQSFEVKVKTPGIDFITTKLSASLIWVSDNYTVRSPILMWLSSL